MAKLFFNSENCKGATSALTGREYTADRQGFIHVNDQREINYLKQGGYIEANAVAPKASRYYVCDNCSWDSWINHCCKCDSSELRVVEK